MYPPPDPNQTILEKLRKNPRLLIVWPALLLLFLATGVFILALNFPDRPESAPLMAVAVVVAIFAVGVLVLVFVVRWLVQKHLRATLITLASLVVLALLFYAEEDWRGRRDWKNFTQQHEAKGEKLDLASFVPPTVPDDQNFAMTPIVASSYAFMLDKNGHELKPHNNNIVNRLSMHLDRESNLTRPGDGDWTAGTFTDLRPWQAYYQQAHILTNAPGPVETNESANMKVAATDVLLALQRYDSDIEELRQAATLPHSRFPLQYDNDDPSQILLPHLGALRTASGVLQLRALAELQMGQSDKAAGDIQLILRLAEASRNEPFLISHFVRMVIVNDARQTIYEGLANHQFSDAQLAALDSQLAQLDFLADYQQVMRSEAVLVARMIDNVRRTHQFDWYMNTFRTASPPEQKIIDGACMIAPGGWFQQNKLGFSKFYLEDCLPLVDMEHRSVSPKAVDAAEAKLWNDLHPPNPYNVLQGLFLLPTGRFMGDKYVPTERFVYAQECADLTRVAIALERYRLAHGQYPNTLAELAPQFLAKVPHDIIGGGSLKYHSVGQNFILYSIGWNGIDDGGLRDSLKEAQPVSTRGDWVWQYP
ncbi:MAG TPA: hypothetical protein VKV04_15370 [Verrucomicrobiae bacterium]|nr:hypothetical protein [Verrucomicrobiae bacterium]